MNFWERLCILCERKGCKPNSVASAIGLSSAIATKWKKGSMPNGETIAAIADFFGCSTDYLLGLTNSPAREAPAELNGETLRFALFGDAKNITEADMEDVRRYAAFIKERKEREK